MLYCYCILIDRNFYNFFNKDTIYIIYIIFVILLMSIKEIGYNIKVRNMYIYSFDQSIFHQNYCS